MNYKNTITINTKDGHITFEDDGENKLLEIQADFNIDRKIFDNTIPKEFNWDGFLDCPDPSITFIKKPRPDFWETITKIYKEMI